MERTIRVDISPFIPNFDMLLDIPDDKDSCKYVDDFLENILREEDFEDVIWYFVDGIS